MPPYLTHIDENRQDVDIIMLNRDPGWDPDKSLLWNVERIKRELVATYRNDRGISPFYLVSPKKQPGKPRKKYKKVYYKLPAALDDPRARQRKCKLDLPFHTSRVVGIRDLQDDVDLHPRRGRSNPLAVPVAPMRTLIALKLKGWERRGALADREDQLHKHNVSDPHDIKQLLILAVQQFRREEGIAEQSWSWNFRRDLNRRVRLFAATYRDTRRRWAELGFDV
jgi:hypothetical protein